MFITATVLLESLNGLEAGATAAYFTPPMSRVNAALESPNEMLKGRTSQGKNISARAQQSTTVWSLRRPDIRRGALFFLHLKGSAKRQPRLVLDAVME